MHESRNHEPLTYLPPILMLLAAFLLLPPGYCLASDGDPPGVKTAPPGAAASREASPPTPALPDREQPHAAQTEPASEPPPLPLHTIEGVSGQFSVPSAYLVNPGPKGEVFGKPAVGYSHTTLGHAKHLQAYTLTETLWNRVELGYALDYLDVGDVYEDFGAATGVRPGGHAIKLHNFNARFQFLREGDFDQPWLPALTAGAHYKYNESLDDLDSDFQDGLGMGLKEIAGIEDDQGMDYTLFASKTVTGLPLPLAVSLGARSTEAAHIGLLGFTGERRIVAEGSFCCMLADGVFFGGEYRQKPSSYDEVPGLVEHEDDWWVLAFCFTPSSHWDIAVGYGHFGELLNHTANRSIGIEVKYEF